MRGALGLGYIMNSLRNAPVDQRAALTAVLSRIDEGSNRVAGAVDALSEQSVKFAETVSRLAARLDDPDDVRRDVPFGRRVLRRIKRLIISGRT
jgi:hypothetical protein